MQSKGNWLLGLAGLTLVMGLATAGSALAGEPYKRVVTKSYAGQAHAAKVAYRKANHRYVPRARHYSRGAYHVRPGHHRRAHVRRYYAHPARYHAPRYRPYRHHPRYHRHHHREINVGAVVAGLVLGGLVHEIIDDDSSDDYSDDDSWSGDEHYDD